MALLSDIGYFIAAVFRQYVLLLTGSGIALAIGIGEHMTQKSLPWISYRAVLGFVFVLAFFRAWREQFRRVKELESALDPKVRRELKTFVDEGTQLRQAIIADADPNPWPRFRAPDNEPVKDKWMDRVEKYLYLSVDSLTSRNFIEEGVSAAVPPYPGAEAWPEHKRDAIKHLDAKIGYLRRLLR
jgi:hypothetical protein